MKTQEHKILSLSEKEFVILNLLVGEPKQEKYGLELVSMSEGRLKRGTVYVTLSRMEDKGYIESRTEENDRPMPGLPRRLYRATGLGERVLRACLLAQNHIYGGLEPQLT